MKDGKTIAESRREQESEVLSRKPEQEERALEEVNDDVRNIIEDDETKGSHNKDREDDTRPRQTCQVRHFGQHQHRMNSHTFYRFYMAIWNKYQGRSREITEELFENLGDLGYVKFSAPEDWLAETPPPPRYVRIHK